MDYKTFSFKFNITLAEQLREVINDRFNVSFTKEDKLNGSSPYWAWDRICAIMDRLEDTLHYVNETELILDGHRSQFAFYEFINNAYVIMDCIKTMGHIFNIDKDKIKQIEGSQDVFGDVLNAGGSDSQFFKYIRSVCCVHPINTTFAGKHPYLLDTKLHCCPFITAKNYYFFGEHCDCDLVAHIYTSCKGKSTIRIPIYINQFEKYLNKWVNFIEQVIEAVKNYCDKVDQEFKNEPLKSIDSFASYVDYLCYLKAEEDRRFSNDMGYIYERYIKILSVQLSNANNQRKLEKYKNAIRYSIVFQHNAIQNMSFDDFENSGINFDDSNSGITLFDSLEYCKCNDSEFSKYGYNLSKINYLVSDDYCDKLFARDLVFEMKDILNKYIVYTGIESDMEIYILVKLALYLESLTKKCLINKNIPNTNEFREKLLSDEELTELNEGTEMNENTRIIIKKSDGEAVEFDCKNDIEKLLDFIRSSSQNK